MSNNNNNDNTTTEEVDDEDIIYKSTELSWSSEDECSLEELFGSSNKPTSIEASSTPKSKKSTPSSSAAKGTAGVTPRRSTRRSSLKAAAAITAIVGSNSSQQQPLHQQQQDDDVDEDAEPERDPDKADENVDEEKNEASRRLEFQGGSDSEQRQEERQLSKSPSLEGTTDADHSKKEIHDHPPSPQRKTAETTEVSDDTTVVSQTAQDDNGDEATKTTPTTSNKMSVDQVEHAKISSPVENAKIPSPVELAKISSPIVADPPVTDDFTKTTEQNQQDSMSNDALEGMTEAESAPSEHVESPQKDSISTLPTNQEPAETHSETNSHAMGRELSAKRSVVGAPINLSSDFVHAVDEQKTLIAASPTTGSQSRDAEIKADAIGKTIATVQQDPLPDTKTKDTPPIIDVDEDFGEMMEFDYVDQHQVQQEPAKTTAANPRPATANNNAEVYDLVTSESESEMTFKVEPAEVAKQNSPKPKANASPLKPAVKPPTPMIVEDSEDDEEVFAAFTCKRKRPVASSTSKLSLKNKKAAKKIKIIMESVPAATSMDIDSADFDEEVDTALDGNDLDRAAAMFTPPEEYDGWFDHDEFMEYSMSFFGETHEDQDPSYIKFIKDQEEKEIRDEMTRLDEEDVAGRKAIEELVQVQLKEKQESTDRNLERYRAKAAEDEQRDLRVLQDRYTETTSSNQMKVSQGLKILQQSHTQEIQKALQLHHQNVSQRRLPDQIGNAEWNATLQQLQAKHHRQMQDFRAKGDEIKKKCDTEYKREQDKVRLQREKRCRDIDAGRQKVFARLVASFQLLRQRYMKRHVQKMIKKKEEIMRKIEKPSGWKETASQAPRDAVQDAKDATLELRPPSPIKSTPDWVEHSGFPTTGAAARHKHRKGVLGPINKQLSVELHNEGLWIYSKLVDEKADADEGDPAKTGIGEDADSNDAKRDDEFIPWGLKARGILQSIICGEIPIGYGADRFNLGEVVAAQGGHIRCVVTDLRTSEETASNQRATAIREQEEASLADLERKSAKLSNMSVESEKNAGKADNNVKECTAAVETAGKDVEKARKAMQDFQTKCRDYISPDGTQLKRTANPSDFERITKAMQRLKVELNAKIGREEKLRAALNDAKNHHQKVIGISRQTQKAATVAVTMLKKRKALLNRSARARSTDALDAEKASTRVKDIIAALRRTADWRRDQLNQKRTSSASSSWVQSLPGVAAPLKKSLWHKMHRRRQQIVLRPCVETFVEDLKSDVKEALRAAQAKKGGDKEHFFEDELVKAEQLFLLATYPASPEKALPSIPPSSSSEQWAEPGWHVTLDVPVDVRRSRALLPSVPAAPVLATNLCEISSAPGRQAASMIQATFLRTLDSELSVVAKATSLAETNPSLTSKMQYAKGDPLHITDESLQVGYSFSSRAAPGKAAPQQRRKSSSKDDTDSVTSTSSKKGAEASGGGSSVTAAEPRSRPPLAPAKTAPKTDRKRRNSKGDGTSPKAPRRKSASSVDGASAQARNFMQQQQQQQQVTAAAGAAMAARGGAYTPHQANQSMDQHAAAAAAAATQYPAFMKPMTPAPSQQSPVPQVQVVGLPPQQLASHHQQQQHQQQQQQQQHPSHQQLPVNIQPQLLQPQQSFNSPIPTVATVGGGDFNNPGYSSPQQQYQQQQRLAQMRMMQQSAVNQQQQHQQQQHQQQQQQQLPFFAPPNSLQQQQVSRQPSFSAAPMVRAPSAGMHPGSSHLPPQGTQTARRGNVMNPNIGQ